jgi:hypothetical protein
VILSVYYDLLLYLVFVYLYMVKFYFLLFNGHLCAVYISLGVHFVTLIVILNISSNHISCVNNILRSVKPDYYQLFVLWRYRNVLFRERNLFHFKLNVLCCFYTVWSYSYYPLLKNGESTFFSCFHYQFTVKCSTVKANRTDCNAHALCASLMNNCRKYDSYM